LQTFQPILMFVERPGAYPRVEHLKGRLRPYFQPRDKAGKACHEQTL
jgi:hypothetical protein